MLTLVLLAAGLPQSDVRLPEGFVLQRASVDEGSFLALAFDAEGRALVGVEDGPIQRFADHDGDGVFEQRETFCVELVACQGLARRGDEWFAVARGPERSGVWRIGADRKAKLLVPIVSTNEHGAHGIAFGPDGALYLAAGNESAMETPQEEGAFFQSGLDGDLLPTIPDPLGVGATTRWPQGFVARIDPETGAWSYHSVGYRNHYDLAFDDEGELFTVDSDMEYDVDLPWYRPVRALHCRFGVDYGFRRGSSVWPEWYDDCGGSIAHVGRGSPTGVVFGHAAQFPDPWREALFCADWAQGRIVAVHLEPLGASYTGRVETFAEGDALASVTDLAIGADGAMYCLRGGRGLRGPMQRIVWRGTPVEKRAAPPKPALLANVDADDASVRSTLRTHTSKGPLADRLARRVCEQAARRGRLDVELVRLAEDVLGRDRFGEKGPKTHDVFDLATAPPRPDQLKAARQAVHAARTRRESAESESQPSRESVDGARLLLAAERGEVAKGDVELALRAVEFGLHDTNDGDDARAALRAIAIAWQRDPDRLAWQDLVREARGGRSALDASRGRGDRPLAWLVDQFEARAGVPRALDLLLDRTERAQDRVEALRAAWLASSSIGWNAEQLRRYLLWYETTRTWTGGACFRGYLRAFRDRATDALTVLDQVVAEDCASPKLSAESFAFALRRLEAASGALELPRLAAARSTSPQEAVTIAVDELARRYDALTDADAKRAVLSELADSRHPRVLDWLRKRVAAKDGESGIALHSLARAAQASDADLFARGLDSAEFGAPKACADALMSLSNPPDDVATWSLVLETARRQGHPRGWQALRVLASWLGMPALDPKPEDFDAARTAIERKARERLPALPPAPPPPKKPEWNHERLQSFLSRTQARPASIAAGEQAFVKATCATCHAIGGRTFAPEISKGAAGPDLGGVSKRLRDDDLFEAIVAPSRAISDQYKTLVVETHDELRFEGRVRRDDARGIELVESDGRAREIEAAEIAAKRISTISAMPEGLLATLTLEEVRDLFAFLRADGVVAGESPAWKPLFDANDREAWSGDATVFRFDDGVLIGRGAQLERAAYLVSRDRWGDFELEFDVWITRGGNSGVQFRSSIVEGARDPLGYQVDVGQIYFGSLYTTDGRGILHEADAKSWRACVEIEGWNHYFVRVEGDRHVIEVNGVVLTDFQDAKFTEGVLAWQVHDRLDMEVRVTNARIRALR